jgi:hypothetical protein
MESASGISGWLFYKRHGKENISGRSTKNMDKE